MGMKRWKFGNLVYEFVMVTTENDQMMFYVLKSIQMTRALDIFDLGFRSERVETDHCHQPLYNL